MQEREMTKKEKAKEKRLKDKYDDSDMKKSMKKQYGDDWKNVYYATIRKKAMEKHVKEYGYKKPLTSIKGAKTKIGEALKYEYMVLDQDGRVMGMATNYRDAEQNARGDNLLGITGRVVKLRRPMSIGRGDRLMGQLPADNLGEAVGDEELLKPMINMDPKTMRIYAKNIIKKYPHMSSSVKAMLPVKEGYKVLPNIDKERYTEIPGLEGPFQTMSGKPIYYDPKEGAYYDRDTDMYLTYDEFRALDNDMKEAMTDKEVNDFHNELDKVVHKHIGHSSDEDEEKERLTKKIDEMPIPKSTMYGLVIDGKYVAKGSKEKMRRMQKEKGGTVYNAPGKKVGDSEGKVKEDVYNKDSVKKNALEALVDIAKTSKKYKGGVTDEQIQILGGLIQDMDLAGIEPEKYSAVNELFKVMATDKKADMTMIQPAYAQVKKIDEGHSPHAKGSAKYKKHMAAKHAAMAEGVKRNAIYQKVGKMLAKGHSMDAIKKRFDDLDKANPGYLEKIAQALKDRNEIPYDKYKSIKGAVESKVTLEDMRNALKLDESTDSNTVIAGYVRTMLNEKHNTWNKVTKEIDFVINLLEDTKADRLQVLKLLYKKNIQENQDNKIELKESIDKLRKIVADKSAMPIKFSDGTMKVDMTTANIFLKAYDSMKESNQMKIQDMMKTKAGFLRVLDFIYGAMK